MTSLNRNRITITLLIFSTLLMSAGSLQAADVNKIIKKMQKKYRDTKSIRIDFVERAEFSLTATSTEIAGTLHMEGKNKFRFETEEQVIVSDGKTVWRFNKLEAQVLVDNAKNENQEVLLNSFLYEINDHYFGQITEEKKEAGKKSYMLKLTPKPSEQSFFTEVEIWVYDKSWEIRQAVYHDLNGNKTEYSIERMEFNPQFPDNLFTFNPPEGTDVVDLRF